MNLHDELDDYGRQASGGALRSADVQARLGAKVRRGRAVRNGAMAGGALALTGVAAFGLAQVLPGAFGAFGPASSQSPDNWMSASIEVVGAEETNLGDAPFVLSHLSRTTIECGTPWELDDGVTVHDPERAADVEATIAAGAYKVTDGGDEVRLDGAVWLGFEAPWWEYSIEASMTGAPFINSAPMLVKDGEIAGFGVLEGFSGTGGSEWAGSGGNEELQFPGWCGGGLPYEEGLEFSDPSAESGLYSIYLVAQWLPQSSEEPILTVALPVATDIEFTGVEEQWANLLPRDMEGGNGDTGNDDPEPTPSELAGEPQFPDVNSDVYLAYVDRAYPGEPLMCQELDSVAPDATWDGVTSWSQAPIPSVLETGRLYGWGDDVLVGGYPAPLASNERPDHMQQVVEDRTSLMGLATSASGYLTLRDDEGNVWGFAVSGSDRDDLPHDNPGPFAEIVPDWNCGADLVPVGEYVARLAVTTSGASTTILEIPDLSVMQGVPSLPEVDAQG